MGTPQADEARYWLALQRAPGIGVQRGNALLDRITSPRELFEAAPAQLRALGVGERAMDWFRRPDWHEVEADLLWLEQPDAHLITREDPRYPTLLRELPDPPPMLMVRGDPGLLHSPQLAIVGSRNPTKPGATAARDFARYLSSAGLSITSGLALGIDGAAHQGALDAGGPTVAVLGTGVDRIYPASHRELAHRIVERGALVSELPLGTPPKAGHFPRRNRIISGLAVGILVVEAARQSGSLITARLAAEQGREVFAMPGSIHNPLARGCHALIREGAKLVETGQDVVEELGALLGGLLAEGEIEPTDGTPAATGWQADEEYRTLLACLAYDPQPVEQLIQASGLTPAAVSSMLIVLELEGLVISFPGGRYCRSGKS